MVRLWAARMVKQLRLGVAGADQPKLRLGLKVGEVFPGRFGVGIVERGDRSLCDGLCFLESNNYRQQTIENQTI
jgi:hypothetical protein